MSLAATKGLVASPAAIMLAWVWSRVRGFGIRLVGKRAR